MKPGLTGCTIAINALSLDYCLGPCVESMLPVCDEVIVSDGGSTDGTREFLDEWAAREPKLRILSHPESLWPDNDQVGNNWINACRKEARYEMFHWQDADEVLDPSSFDEMRRAVALKEPRIFNYVNFWYDSFHTVQWGDGLKEHLKPSWQWCPVHGENPPGYVNERHTIKSHPSLITYHYSALRRREAFIAKCKVIGKRHAFGYNDQPLMQSERTGESFMPLYEERMSRLQPFEGRHPDVIKPWLQERGWATEPPETLPAEIEIAIEKRADHLDVDGVEKIPIPDVAVPPKRFRGDFLDSRGKPMPI